MQHTDEEARPPFRTRELFRAAKIRVIMRNYKHLQENIKRKLVLG